ncbi:hypothetical protein ABK040_016676 [Willaertia magna]
MLPSTNNNDLLNLNNNNQHSVNNNSNSTNNSAITTQKEEEEMKEKEKKKKIITLKQVDFESFGQVESIVSRLHSILHDYPKGTQIFRELLQNADDAKASTFRICFDERIFHSSSSSSLSNNNNTSLSERQQVNKNENSYLSNRMKRINEVPSLIVFNDALFEEKDYESIRKLGHSQKRLDKQKVGRFGLGFNSVYHLSDYPTFISGENIVIFDPHRKIIPRELLVFGDPGIRVNFVENHEHLVKNFKSQFIPFEGLFGCQLLSSNYFNYTKREEGEGQDDDKNTNNVSDDNTMNKDSNTNNTSKDSNINNKGFNGTMFRFPLRLPGDVSEISDHTFSREEMFHMFKNFMKETVDNVLFLKHVKCIELYHIDKNQVDQLVPKPKLMYKLNVNCPTKEDEENRDYLSTILSSSLLEEDVILKNYYSYQLHIEQTIYQIEDDDDNTDNREQKQEQPIIETHNSEQWIIGCYLAKEGKAKELSNEALKKDPSSRMIPFANIACKLLSQNNNNNQKNTIINGKPYCFLNLPIHTGLPIHINSFFELTSNRRELMKGSSNELEGSDKLRSNWNEALKTSVIAFAYYYLLKEILNNNLNNFNLQWYYSLFPNSDNLGMEWKVVSDKLYQLIYENNLEMLLDLDNRLISPKQIIVLPNLENVSVDTTIDKNNYKKDYNNEENNVVLKSIQYILRESNFNVLKSIKLDNYFVPKFIVKSFENAKCSLIFVTPEFIRNKLREEKLMKSLLNIRNLNNNSYNNNNNRDYNNEENLLFKKRIFCDLLLYIVSDCSNEDFTKLNNVPIIPICNNYNQNYNNENYKDLNTIMGKCLTNLNDESIFFYLVNNEIEFKILTNYSENLKRKIIDLTILDHESISLFERIIYSNQLNIRSINSKYMSILLKNNLFKLKELPLEEISLQNNTLQNTLQHNFKNTFTFISNKEKENEFLKLFCNEYLPNLYLEDINNYFKDFPIIPTTLPSLHKITINKLLFIEDKEDNNLKELQQIFTKLGIRFIDNSLCYNNLLFQKINLLRFSCNHLLKLLNDLNNSSKNSIIELIDKNLNFNEKQLFLNYLILNGNNIDSIYFSFIKKLPLFTTYNNNDYNNDLSSQQQSRDCDNYEMKTISLSNNNCYLPSPYLEEQEYFILQNNNFIKTNGSKSLTRFLEEILKIPILNLSTIYLDYYFPKMNNYLKKERIIISLSILSKLNILEKEDFGFIQKLKNISFIPCSFYNNNIVNNNNTIVNNDEDYNIDFLQPKEVIHPISNEELGFLLKDFKLFPIKEITKNENLLKQLELLNIIKSLKPTILNIIINKICETNNLILKFEMSKKLIKFLIENELRIFNNENNENKNKEMKEWKECFNEIKNLKWIPTIGPLSTNSNNTNNTTTVTSRDSETVTLREKSKNNKKNEKKKKINNSTKIEDSSKQLLQTTATNLSLFEFLKLKQEILNFVNVNNNHTVDSNVVDNNSELVVDNTIVKYIHFSSIMESVSLDNFNLFFTMKPICIFSTFTNEGLLNKKLFNSWNYKNYLTNNLNTIVTHLQNLSILWSKNTIDNNVYNNNDINYELTTITNSIYEILEKYYLELNNYNNDYNNNNTDYKDYNNNEIIKTILLNNPTIWIGNQFIYSKQLAFTQTNVNLSPYLFIVPTQLLRFKNLLKNIYNIKQVFEFEDYINVLQKLSNLTNLENVKLSIILLQILYNDCKFKEYQKKNTILIPNIDNEFYDARKLCYIDSKELYENLSQNISEFRNLLVHLEISNEVASALGAQSLSSFLEETTSELLSSNNSLQNLQQYGEVFGQHELLTTRISNILNDYPFTESSIFKELLQNAEDANANEFIVIYDRNHYNTNTLFNKNLEPFQGPSLIIYNNNKFTQEDIKSLQNLGVGTKLKELNKIGRFSLGFNSVYHFTDLPFILTGDKLLVLDPHACFIKGSSMNHPGRMYRYLNQGFYQSFNDQLSPFLQQASILNNYLFSNNLKDDKLINKEGIEENTGLNGTMIRLPLRTRQLAEQSKISKSFWTHLNIMEQLESFVKEAKHCLLFLKNIKNIKIFIKHSENETEELLNISVKKSKEIIEMENELLNTMLNLKQEQQNLLQKSNSLQKSTLQNNSQQQSLLSKKKSKKKQNRKSALLKVTTNEQEEEEEEEYNNLNNKNLNNNKNYQSIFNGIINLEIKEKNKIEKEKWLISGTIINGGYSEIWKTSIDNLKTQQMKYRMIPFGSIATKINSTTITNDKNDNNDNHSTSDSISDNNNDSIISNVVSSDVVSDKSEDDCGLVMNVDSSLNGRAYSFLPLPTETGLAFHMNGYFELGSNRRDIWQSKFGSNTTTTTATATATAKKKDDNKNKKKINEKKYYESEEENDNNNEEEEDNNNITVKDPRNKWNQLLITSCIVPSLLNSITIIVKNIIHTTNLTKEQKQLLFYNLMKICPIPSKIGTNTLIGSILKPFYSELSQMKIFYTMSFSNQEQYLFDLLTDDYDKLLNLNNNISKYSNNNNNNLNNKSGNFMNSGTRGVSRERFTIYSKKQLHYFLINYINCPICILPQEVIDQLKIYYSLQTMTLNNNTIEFISSKNVRKYIRDYFRNAKARHNLLLELKKTNLTLNKENINNNQINNGSNEMNNNENNEQDNLIDLLFNIWKFTLKEEIILKNAEEFEYFPVPLFKEQSIMFLSFQNKQQSQQQLKKKVITVPTLTNRKKKKGMSMEDYQSSFFLDYLSSSNASSSSNNNNNNNKKKKDSINKKDSKEEDDDYLLLDNNIMNNNQYYYLEDTEDIGELLLSSISNQLISTIFVKMIKTLQPELFEKLPIKNLNADAIKQLLKDTLPELIFTSNNNQFPYLEFDKNSKTIQLVTKVLNFIEKEFLKHNIVNISSLLEDFAIIPAMSPNIIDNTLQNNSLQNSLENSLQNNNLQQQDDKIRLYFMKRAKQVIFITKREQKAFQLIEKILQKLNFSIIHPMAIHLTCLQECTTTFDESNLLLLLIDQLQNNKRLQNNNLKLLQLLTVEEKRKLLAYFNPSLMSKEDLEKLKTLPLFETINYNNTTINNLNTINSNTINNNNFIALSSFKGNNNYKIFIEPRDQDLSKIPTIPHNSVIILKDNPSLSTLYSTLQLKYANILILYQEVILPKFNKELTNNQQLEHLNFIIKNKRLKDGLKSTLQEIPFINGKKPKELCDPTNYFFKTFLQQPNNENSENVYNNNYTVDNSDNIFFPSPFFDSDEWIKYLKEMGLQTEITINILKECCKRFEEECNLLQKAISLILRTKNNNNINFKQKLKDKFEKAKILFDHLYQHQSKFINHSEFMTRLSNYNILPISNLFNIYNVDLFNNNNFTINNNLIDNSNVDNVEFYIKIIKRLKYNNTQQANNNNTIVKKQQDQQLKFFTNMNIAENEKYIDIIFTQSPIYNSSFELIVNLIQHHVRKSNKPDSKIVIRHLEKLAEDNDTLQNDNNLNNDEYKKKMKQIILSIYRYLNNHCLNRTFIDFEKRKIIYLISENKFQYPTRIFWKFKNYFPYICKVPEEYLEFKPLFDKWKIQELPSKEFCYQILYTLRQLQLPINYNSKNSNNNSNTTIIGEDKIISKQLNNNQLNEIVYLLNDLEINLSLKIIKLLIEEYQESLEGSFLLNSNNELIPHRFIVINDSPFLYQNIKKNIFHFLSNQLIEYIDQLQLKTLSSLVHEQLDITVDNNNLNLLNNNNQNSLNNNLNNVVMLSNEKKEMKERLMETIHSKEFLLSFDRILKHQVRQQQEKKVEDYNERQITSTLQKLFEIQQMNIVMVNQLNSKFIHALTKQDITLQDDEEEELDNSDSNNNKKKKNKSLCFIDSINKTIYLSLNIPPFIDIYNILSQQLNRYLNYPIKDSNLISSLLKCKPNEMNELLDILNITLIHNVKEEDKKQQDVVLLPAISFSGLKRKLGALVTEKDKQYFAKESTRETLFYEGELIAYDLFRGSSYNVKDNTFSISDSSSDEGDGNRNEEKKKSKWFSWLLNSSSSSSSSNTNNTNNTNNRRREEEKQEEEEKNFKYGRIIKKLSETTYQVEIEHSVYKTLSIEQLFKFDENQINLNNNNNDPLSLMMMNNNNQNLLEKEQNIRQSLMQSLTCPITREVFRDPVTISDGNTYEREAIINWFKVSDISPLTREKLNKQIIIPNRMLQSIVREFIDND